MQEVAALCDQVSRLFLAEKCLAMAAPMTCGKRKTGKENLEDAFVAVIGSARGVGMISTLVIFQKEMLDNMRDYRSWVTGVFWALFGPLLLGGMIMLFGNSIRENVDELLILPVSGAEMLQPDRFFGTAGCCF